MKEETGREKREEKREERKTKRKEDAHREGRKGFTYPVDRFRLGKWDFTCTRLVSVLVLVYVCVCVCFL